MIRTIAACEEGSGFERFRLFFIFIDRTGKFGPADSNVLSRTFSYLQVDFSTYAHIFLPAGTFSYPPRLRDAWPPPPMKKCRQYSMHSGISFMISAVSAFTAAFVQNT